ncbi:hypothetical protein Droror1_Dr00000576 [Drosera rotundifolia]
MQKICRKGGNIPFKESQTQQPVKQNKPKKSSTTPHVAVSVVTPQNRLQLQLPPLNAQKSIPLTLTSPFPDIASASLILCLFDPQIRCLFDPIVTALLFCVVEFGDWSCVRVLEGEIGGGLVVVVVMEVEVEEARPAMTFDEASMERSKNFVKALQELKNLRPQLYSAAEYCEKSYLNSEQKQMVLDNLKDYAMRALVNAVDHLGTVAYKLTDLLEQQTSDVSTMELKVSCLNQQLLTCQTYTDKEGIRQQQLLAIVPRHHKRYVLPNLINKKVHFSPNVQNDPRQTHVQARPRVHPSASPSAKTLSWHLASETKPSLKGSQKSSTCSEGQRNSLESSGEFDFLGNEPGIGKKSSSTHSERSTGSRSPLSSIIRQPFGNGHKDTSLDSRPLTPFRSFETPTRQVILRAPSRGKGVLSSLFAKQKVPKLKAGAVA